MIQRARRFLGLSPAEVIRRVFTARINLAARWTQIRIRWTQIPIRVPFPGDSVARPIGW